MPTGIGGEKLWLCPTLDDSANDLSGNSNNGTYYGGMGTVADTSNGGTRAYSFDGSNDYINIANRSNFNFFVQTDSWSVSAWVYLDTINAQRTIFGGEGDNTGYGVRLLEHSYNSLGYRATRSMLTSVYNPDTRTNAVNPTGTWHHVCWVASGSSSKIFVDGVEEGSQTYSALTTTNSLTSDVLIGAYESGGTIQSFMDGLQDDIRVFDRALSTSEITALASKRGYEVPAAGGDIPHALSSPFHPLG